MNYTPVIGLEVHVELSTKSKMFCRCDATYFGKEPNTHTCPVCLGLPGALPVPNKKAIEWCIKIGLALNCEIPMNSKFDRKNYFYPDLAKGYQISQYDEPFAINGWIEVNSSSVILGTNATPESRKDPGQARMTKKRIRIRRVHMEEDTAKLTHQFGNQKSSIRQAQDKKIKNQKEGEFSLIDFNRSGVPLVEIVTEPDFENSYEVVQYLQELQRIVRYLGASNADMEKGDMRLEPNISLRVLNRHSGEEQRDASRITEGSWTSQDDKLPPYKVEVKNINSFRFAEKAIEFELKRQAEILDEGKIPVQETRGWNETKQKTLSQRVKEEAMDYRYFPDPDIPPFKWTEDYINKLKTDMPELPDEKRTRFQKEYKLSFYDSEILTREREFADFFEKAVSLGKEKSITPKQIANALINKKVSMSSTPQQVIKTISDMSQVTEIDEKELEKVIQEVLKENPKSVEDYKSGKIQVIGFLIGMTKKKLATAADTNQIKNKIEELLK